VDGNKRKWRWRVEGGGWRVEGGGLLPLQEVEQKKNHPFFILFPEILEIK